MLAEVFRRFGPSYRERFGARLLASHARVLADLLRCRTPAAGGHLYVCQDCGKQHFVGHSCRNRHCPLCGTGASAAWLAARRGEMLGTGYFHVVFTVSAALRDVCRAHQQTVYPLLFQTAYAALQELADDARHVGGQLAVLSVLHTWSGALIYHPHIHCLVAAGGLAPDGRWHSAKPGFLVPVQALSVLFRGKLIARLKAALPQANISRRVWRDKWSVYCHPTPADPQRTLDYLGRYLHRVAITNTRIVATDEHHVTFRYRDEARTGWRTVTLTGHEFLRRFLQHVLPKGCHKVRYFGLWHPRQRVKRRQVAAQLALARTTPVPPATPAGRPRPAAGAEPSPVPRCPHCGSARVTWLKHVLPEARAP